MTTGSLIEIPLAIDLRFPNQPPYVRDLSQLPCQSLARDLARALLERTNTSGTITSPATVKEFLTALRHFCRWMGDRGFDGGTGELSEDLVFDYWRHSGARIEANTRKLLAQIEAKRPGTSVPTSPPTWTASASTVSPPRHPTSPTARARPSVSSMSAGAW